MEKLLTKENLKKLAIAIVVAILGYFGYNTTLTPKVETTETKTEVIDTTKVDTL